MISKIVSLYFIYSFIHSFSLVLDLNFLKCILNLSFSPNFQVIKSAKENQEVGLAFNDYTLRFKKHDSVEAYQEICAKVTISWNPPGF